MDHIRISPRHLGKMKMQDFCEKCYVVWIASGFKPPFEFPVPGIMYNLDIFEKQLVDSCFAENGYFPKWLKSLGCVEPIQFPRKMTKDYDEFALTLVGMPDAIFKKRDGSLCVVDYKSAKYKDGNSPLIPAYEVQLLGYAELAEHYKLGKVSSAALVYFENQLTDYKENPLVLLEDEGFTVPFSVEIHKAPLDRKELKQLLKAFRKYADMYTMPAGREACKNCAKIQSMVETYERLEKRGRALNDLLLGDRNTLLQRAAMFQQDQQERVALASRNWEADLEDAMDIDVDVVPAVWDM